MGVIPLLVDIVRYLAPLFPKMAMKMRMKKVKKVSKVGKKWQVFSGKKEKSTGGLKKADLVMNRNGKVVSKKMSLNGKKGYAKRIGKWHAACEKARKQLGIKGFVAIGGKTAQGQAFLKAARSIYAK